MLPYHNFRMGEHRNLVGRNSINKFGLFVAIDSKHAGGNHIICLNGVRVKLL